MTVWSAVDNHLQVGVDLTTSDGTPTYGESITLTCKWYVKSGTKWNDTQTLNWIFAGSSGTKSFTNTVDGSTQLVLTKTYTLTADAFSHTVQGHGTISGAYNGANPNVSDSITVPASPGVPNTPAAPTTNGAAGATSLPIKWTAPATNGSAITGYQIARRVGSGANTYISLGTGLSTTLTGLTPATTYSIFVRANSAAGWSPWSNALTFATIITAPANSVNVRLEDTSTPSGYAAHITWTAGGTNGASGVTYDTCVSLYDNAGAPFSTTLSTTLSTGAALTSLPINSFTTFTPAAGDVVTVYDPTRAHFQTFVVDAGSTSTNIAVIAQTPNFAYPTGSTVLFGAAKIGQPLSGQTFTGVPDGILASSTYYGYTRVASTTPASVGAWQHGATSVTMGANGGQGDLVDRVNALAAQLGADVARLRSSFRPFTTAGRPSAATAGDGGCYYDTTLNKPGWSDGATWRDAAGTAI